MGRPVPRRRAEPGRGPAAGLAALEAIEGLADYVPLDAARANLLRRLGRPDEAVKAYRRALELAVPPADRPFERLLSELAAASQDRS